MIDKALRSFCEARHRTLIVIAGTFLVGLVLILPLVDVIRTGRAEREVLTTELVSAKAIASSLAEVETQVAAKLAELKVLESRAVDDASLPALREKLVDLAKETGCSVRRLNVAPASSRSWKPGESPTAPATLYPNEPITTFKLEWRPVSVSLSGSSSNLRTMLERITASGMLVHAKNVDIYPSSPSRQSLTMDLELWYFTLGRHG